MPATRSRSSAPEGSAIASVDPGAQPQRVGEPGADLGLAGCPRSRCPAVSGGASKIV